HSLQRGIFDRNRIIEDDHDAVARITFECAAVLDDYLADSSMILGQERHDVFWVRAFCEAGKAAQIAEQGRNFPAMAFKLLFSSRGDYQIGDLLWEETAQPAHAFDLADLISDALFQFFIQFDNLRGPFTQFLQ